MTEAATSEFAASLTILESVREFVRRFAAPRLADRRCDALDRLILAVHEAASNIVRHAFEGRPGRFRVQVRDDGDRLVVTLEHDGRPFDPACARAPAFDGSCDGGFGLYLIRLCVDSVTYHVDDGGTSRVTLVRRVPTIATESPDQDRS